MQAKIYYIFEKIYKACKTPPPSPPRWGWFLGLGVLPPWNPIIMQGISVSPSPPLWGGLGVVCMYLRRLVGVYIYIYMYVYMHICRQGGEKYVSKYIYIFFYIYIWVGGIPSGGGIAGCRSGSYIYLYIYIISILIKYDIIIN